MPVKRSVLFTFRLTPGELEQVRQAADKAGLRPTEWARQLIVASATSLAFHPYQSEGLQISLTSTGQVKNVSTSAE